MVFDPLNHPSGSGSLFFFFVPIFCIFVFLSIHRGAYLFFVIGFCSYSFSKDRLLLFLISIAHNHIVSTLSTSSLPIRNPFLIHIFMSRLGVNVMKFSLSSFSQVLYLVSKGFSLGSHQLCPAICQRSFDLGFDQVSMLPFSDSI